MSKTYKTESIAKSQATKAAKKAGEQYIHHELESGEWEVVTLAEFKARTSPEKTTVIKIPSACWKEISGIVMSEGVTKVELEVVGKRIYLNLNEHNHVWFFLDSRIADNAVKALQNRE